MSIPPAARRDRAGTSRAAASSGVAGGAYAAKAGAASAWSAVTVRARGRARSSAVFCQVPSTARLISRSWAGWDGPNPSGRFRQGELVRYFRAVASSVRR
ncbi:hypothetical protein GCM10010347_52220 [Streptomyces cirratus]|uniref:Uncharacterized protein n=1 Tax=Streptomyces cirratus TaxID=68187 RepID=A0ABQ3F111_9ACTN|nr:hypothetical protein GCM10010347_52220 [Streptomyces cirratus]